MAGQNDTKRTTAEIQQELDAHRRRIGSTLDEVEARLRPERLKNEATAKIREQTVGRVEQLTDSASDTMKGASTDVFESIKNNPLPAALAAIGLGWLFMESRNQSQNRANYQGYRGQRKLNRYDPYDRFDNYDYRYAGEERNESRDYSPSSGRSPADRARQAAGGVQDKAEQAVGQAQDKVSDMTDQLQGKAQDLASSAQDFAGQAQDQVQQWAGAAQDQAYRVRSRFEDMMDEKPLLIGAAAMALGAAIGMSLPSTEKEDQLVGSMRDDRILYLSMNSAVSPALSRAGVYPFICRR